MYDAVGINPVEVGDFVNGFCCKLASTSSFTLYIPTAEGSARTMVGAEADLDRPVGGGDLGGD